MYITTYKKNTALLNPTYQDLFSLSTNIINTKNVYTKTTIKITNPKKIEELNTNQKNHIKITEEALNLIITLLEPYKENHETQYYEFKIPKANGGLRTIDAPNTNFKNTLTLVKDIFENKIQCLPHNAAHAYVKQCSTITALKKHQENESIWFLKLDLKDFFTNCTEDIFVNNLKNLYPFYYISDIEKKLSTIFKICSLRQGLPQGSPISPYLTNLIMVPYDFLINSICKKRNLIYTRYADDMLISGKEKFNWKSIQSIINLIIKPFKIKKEKTRFGNKCGKNWNLGLMLNKDNNITLGYRKKRELNAALNNYIRTYPEKTLEETQQLAGELSYLKQIEPNYYNYLIHKYNTKYNVNINTLFQLKII